MAKGKKTELQEKVFEEYMRKTPKSKQMYDRACNSLEGGVPASTRFFSPYPLYMTHGRGSKIYDVDGNEYVDCLLNFGSLILGHHHPEVVEAVKRELDRGLLVVNSDLAVECAELLKEIIPCAEKVRFFNIGAEVIMFAARVARAFTGKNKIIKFYGHFHGMVDQFLIGIFNTSDEITSAGVTKESLTNTILLKYSDIDAVRRKLDEDNDIAGVILDPGMHKGGLWPSSREYLQELRQLTEERGVVLIFDEIITGFRLAPGGAQEYFGVTPDLAVFAKGIASGAKLAVLVGKEKVMSVLIPGELSTETVKVVSHGATFVDGTMALGAALATLKAYKKLNEKGEYQRLFQLTEKLKTGMEMAFKKSGIPCHINMLGPMLKIFLTDLQPSFDVYCRLDTTASELLALSLISEGIWLIPKAVGMFLSFAHTDEDIEKIICAVDNCLDKNKFQLGLLTGLPRH